MTDTAIAPAVDQVDEAADSAVDVVIDGRVLTDDEVEALLQKPLEGLTDAEREGLQPLFDAVRTEQPQGVDVLTIASDLLQDAVTSLLSKPRAGQRLEHKIALGHAMAALVQAQAARHLAMLTQQQLQLVVQSQQAAVAKAAGPASILVPQHVAGVRG